MNGLTSPHSSQGVKELENFGKERRSELESATSLPKIPLSSREYGDLIMIGIGGFAPLTDFMGYVDWQRVCAYGVMSNGTFWPVPITITTTLERAKALKENAMISLTWEDEIVATMYIRQNYGCSHQIIRRDHAGVGTCYGPIEAPKILGGIPQGEIKFKLPRFDLTFWRHDCGSMASNTTCHHSDDRRLQLYGTRLRNLLTNGEDVMPNLSRKWH